MLRRVGATSTSIALDLAAMRRARTNILPHRGADRLVTGGVFALTRNPIYLGNTPLLAGLGVAFPSMSMVAGALLAALRVDRLAIRREQRHLSARFGQAYADDVARFPAGSACTAELRSRRAGHRPASVGLNSYIIRS